MKSHKPSSSGFARNGTSPSHEAPHRPVETSSALGGTDGEWAMAMQDSIGNQAILNIMRSGGGVPDDDPASAFSSATRGEGRSIPMQAEMESAFGRDFSGVKAHLGQRAPLAGMGARAATDGSQVAFASETPDTETVAHELAHVVQVEQAGSALQAKPLVSSPGDAAETEADKVGAAVASTGTAPAIQQSPTGSISGGWLSDAANAVGDALDMREDEERLDAEEELEEFRERSFPRIERFSSPAGVGQFAVDFDAATGDLSITVRVFFEFTAGDPSQVAPGFRPEEFQWNGGEEAQWKTQYMALFSSAWSSPATGIIFRSTKPYWTSMQVDVGVQVVETASRGDAHFVVQVAKYPDDAAMVGSSVCSPGRHHSGNYCVANTDAGTPANYQGMAGSTVELDSNDLRAEQKLDWGNAVTQVHFGRGGNALDAAGQQELQPVIQQMQANAASHAELTGHASADHRQGVNASDGAIENMDLARSRTASVQAALNGAGISNDRLLIRNVGEQGASDDESWCRVDIQVGTNPTQTAALHEGGHMLGNSDEYSSAGATPSYDAMVLAQTGQVVAHQDNANIMSVGGTIQPWNYSAFLASLKQISGLDEWSL